MDGGKRLDERGKSLELAINEDGVFHMCVDGDS